MLVSFHTFFQRPPVFHTFFQRPPVFHTFFPLLYSRVCYFGKCQQKFLINYIKVRAHACMHTHVKACGFVYERSICLVLDAYPWDWLASEKPAQMPDVSFRHTLENGCMTCLSKYVVCFLLDYHKASLTQAFSFHFISRSYLFLLQHTWFCLQPWFISSLCISSLRFCLYPTSCNCLGMYECMHVIPALMTSNSEMCKILPVLWNPPLFAETEWRGKEGGMTLVIKKNYFNFITILNPFQNF